MCYAQSVKLPISRNGQAHCPVREMGTVSAMTFSVATGTTDKQRMKTQLQMLRDWNRWTEVLTVTRWIWQQPMMTSTCSGINSSVIYALQPIQIKTAPITVPVLSKNSVYLGLIWRKFSTFYTDLRRSDVRFFVIAMTLRLYIISYGFAVVKYTP